MLNVFAALPRPAALLDLIGLGSGFVWGQDDIRYTIAPSTSGQVLFAISNGRLVSLELGDDAGELVRRFRAAHPSSREAKGDPVFWDAGIEVLRAIENVDGRRSRGQADAGTDFAASVRKLLFVQEGQPIRYAEPALH